MGIVSESNRKLLLWLQKHNIHCKFKLMLFTTCYIYIFTFILWGH